MRFKAIILAVLAAILLIPGAQAASVIARVDKSSQTMTVYHHGEVIGRWKVSTARAGKVTQIIVENGAPVEYGEPLLVIE